MSLVEAYVQARAFPPVFAVGDLVRIRSRPSLGEVVVVRVDPLVLDLGGGWPVAWSPLDVVPSDAQA